MIKPRRGKMIVVNLLLYERNQARKARAQFRRCKYQIKYRDKELVNVPKCDIYLTLHIEVTVAADYKFKNYKSKRI